MEEKAQLVFEFDRTDYEGVTTLCKMAGADFGDPDSLWSEMTKQPILLDPDQIGDTPNHKKTEVQLALILFAMKITKDKTKTI